MGILKERLQRCSHALLRKYPDGKSLMCETCGELFVDDGRGRLVEARGMAPRFDDGDIAVVGGKIPYVGRELPCTHEHKTTNMYGTSCDDCGTVLSYRMASSITPAEAEALRVENATLKKRVAMLESERGPGIKAPSEPQIVCDYDWD